MIRIRSDESLFIVSKRTLEQYSNSDIYKIADGQDIKNDFIFRDEKDGTITLYIDCDPEIMKIIIGMIRGRETNVESHMQSYILKPTMIKLGMLNPIISEPTVIVTHVENSNVLVGGNNTPTMSSETILSDALSDSFTLGITTTEQNNIGDLFKNKSNDTELSEFSSDVAKSVSESINNPGKKHGRKLRPKIFTLIE